MKFGKATHFDPLKPVDILKRTQQVIEPDGADADGVRICATWRIQLNRPYVAAMRPYVKLL